MKGIDPKIFKKNINLTERILSLSLENWKIIEIIGKIVISSITKKYEILVVLKQNNKAIRIEE